MKSAKNWVITKSITALNMADWEKVTAKPIQMKLYAKHKNPLTHLFMSSILHFVSPGAFELRKPFKAKFNSVSTL